MQGRPLKYLRYALFPVAAVIGLCLVTVLFFTYQMRLSIQSHQQHAIDETSQIFRHTIELHQAVAQLSYESALDTHAIRQLLWQIQRQITSLPHARSELQSHVKYTFNALRQVGFDRLYFHDAHGRVVLRMHAPGVFGDDQRLNRSMVGDIVHSHQPISGFESGRMTAGLRFLFPLEYQGVFVGSVEIVRSSPSLARFLSAAMHANYRILIPRSTFDQRIPSEGFGTLHTGSSLCEGYLVERSLASPGIMDALDNIDDQLKQRRAFSCRQLLDEEPQAQAYRLDGRDLLLIFLPIPVYHNATWAYLVAYRDAPAIGEIRQHYQWALVGLLLVVLLALLYIFQRTKSRLAQEQYATELEAKARELERSNRYKSEFLANVSHELRTPLNSILMLSSLLKRKGQERFDASEQQKLEVIHICGRELMSMIDDLLDFSRLEAGRMEVHLEAVHSSYLVDNLRSKFQSLADEKGLEFQVEDQWSDSMVTDSKRLLQVVQNLLSNAFKFTSQGRVSLFLGHSDDALRPLLILVSDTGIGIAPQKQHLIFEAFTQADGSINRQYEGAGLGLAISCELTRLLGGELVLSHSQVGVGSCFALTLPRESVYHTP